MTTPPDNDSHVGIDNNKSLEIQPPPTASRLCDVCLLLGQLPASIWTKIHSNENVEIPHHQSVDDLIRSAIRGCRMCSLMQGALEQQYRIEQANHGRWMALTSTTLLYGRVRLKFMKIFSPNIVELKDEVCINILCDGMSDDRVIHLICYHRDKGEPLMILLIRMFETDETRRWAECAAGDVRA
jgi:hypothetical protein